jgi:ubiquitin-protein ligase E3 B
MSTFVEKIKFDILTGLFCVESFLKRLWIFICELGPSGGLYLFETIIDETNETLKEANEPYLAVLSLFCQCSSLLLSIADDEEFFTEQHPFTLEESKTISVGLGDSRHRCHVILKILHKIESF